MLTAHNLSYSRQNQHIFKNLGFSIGLGSCLLITGQNGSGKTSLLRILATINENHQGEILWNSQNIKELQADFRSDIKYIGHKNFLKPQLTVFENLNFYAELSDTKILIPSALRYFELEKLVNTPISELSKGWQQRVLLSILLCCPTTIWILDEPSIHLDKAGKELLYNLIAMRIKDDGIVICATHDEMFFKLGSKLCLEDFRNNN